MSTLLPRQSASPFPTPYASLPSRNRFFFRQSLFSLSSVNPLCNPQPRIELFLFLRSFSLQFFFERDPPLSFPQVAVFFSRISIFSTLFFFSINHSNRAPRTFLIAPVFFTTRTFLPCAPFSSNKSFLFSCCHGLLPLIARKGNPPFSIGLSWPI